MSNFFELSSQLVKAFPSLIDIDWLRLSHLNFSVETFWNSLIAYKKALINQIEILSPLLKGDKNVSTKKGFLKMIAQLNNGLPALEHALRDTPSDEKAKSWFQFLYDRCSQLMQEYQGVPEQDQELWWNQKASEVFPYFYDDALMLTYVHFIVWSLDVFTIYEILRPDAAQCVYIVEGGTHCYAIAETLINEGYELIYDSLPPRALTERTEINDSTVKPLPEFMFNYPLHDSHHLKMLKKNIEALSPEGYLARE